MEVAHIVVFLDVLSQLLAALLAPSRIERRALSHSLGRPGVANDGLLYLVGQSRGAVTFAGNERVANGLRVPLLNRKPFAGLPRPFENLVKPLLKGRSTLSINQAPSVLERQLLV